MALKASARVIPRFERKPHVMIVEARFYADLADELVRGAEQVLKEAGATWERFAVPGAFEIPAAIALGSRAGKAVPPRRGFDGYVALGCVVRGETTHYDYVCGESARGLQDLAVQQGLAIGYGILTVDTMAQAWARARIAEQDKGGDAAHACLAMIALGTELGLRPR
jgi:6,7-dimethyl-8-ribityllumazine synthase